MTLPVGDGPPDGPLTATTTLNACDIRRLFKAGLKFTVGVIVLTATELEPVAPVYRLELAESGV
jgi:hypothetical protein